jgi:diaminopimelate epimerase
LKFWKYHGIGNDFVVVENFDGKISKDPVFVRSVCDRRFGVGADGILYIELDSSSDARMVVMNSDGSEAEMCGNGIRCVAKHLYERGIMKKTKMTIGTLAGTKTVECIVKDGKVDSVIVEMGSPHLDGKDIPMKCEGRFIEGEVNVDGVKVKGTGVSMGNPHFIIFQHFSADAVDSLGPKLEKHPMFPRRTNVEFVKLVDGILTVKVYERGAAWTMACGTGACATVVAAALLGKVPFDKEVEVALPGGSLWITVTADMGSVRMRGPAKLVYQGETI